jgi:catechol 2,3-dioxygenase-like lactoylglutathione lyase family enzyme
MSQVSVRYIVNDVDQSLPFYTDLRGFTVQMHPAPGFAMLTRGDLRLLLNSPGAGGAGQTLADGSVPQPGGWNRIQIETDDLDTLVANLRSGGATFRSDVLQGVGGRQALVQDPSGNLIELFEPAPPGN